jgi:hypothetical protein
MMKIFSLPLSSHACLPQAGIIGEGEGGEEKV